MGTWLVLCFLLAAGVESAGISFVGEFESQAPLADSLLVSGSNDIFIQNTLTNESLEGMFYDPSSGVALGDMTLSPLYGPLTYVLFVQDGYLWYGNTTDDTTVMYQAVEYSPDGSHGSTFLIGSGKTDATLFEMQFYLREANAVYGTTQRNGDPEEKYATCFGIGGNVLYTYDSSPLSSSDYNFQSPDCGLILLNSTGTSLSLAFGESGRILGEPTVVQVESAPAGTIYGCFSQYGTGKVLYSDDSGKWYYIYINNGSAESGAVQVQTQFAGSVNPVCLLNGDLYIVESTSDSTDIYYLDQEARTESVRSFSEFSFLDYGLSNEYLTVRMTKGNFSKFATFAYAEYGGSGGGLNWVVVAVGIVVGLILACVMVCWLCGEAILRSLFPF